MTGDPYRDELRRLRHLRDALGKNQVTSPLKDRTFGGVYWGWGTYYYRRGTFRRWIRLLEHELNRRQLDPDLFDLPLFRDAARGGSQ